jgi:hypothetical protein
MDAVKAALDDGWIGVDIKNVYEENGETIVAPSDDLNPAHWTLILRKKEPKLELVS